MSRTIPTLEEIAETPEKFPAVIIEAELAAVLIVQRRRLDALEQQARPFQESGRLAVDKYDLAMQDQRDRALQRAETAERERDEWQASANRRLDEREAALAKVERLREQLQIVAECNACGPCNSRAKIALAALEDA